MSQSGAASTARHGAVADRHDQHQAPLHLDHGLGDRAALEHPGRALGQADQPGRDGGQLVGPVRAGNPSRRPAAGRRPRPRPRAPRRAPSPTKSVISQSNPRAPGSDRSRALLTCSRGSAADQAGSPRRHDVVTRGPPYALLETGQAAAYPIGRDRRHRGDGRLGRRAAVGREPGTRFGLGHPLGRPGSRRGRRCRLRLPAGLRRGLPAGCSTAGRRPWPVPGSDGSASGRTGARSARTRRLHRGEDRQELVAGGSGGAAADAGDHRHGPRSAVADSVSAEVRTASRVGRDLASRPGRRNRGRRRRRAPSGRLGRRVSPRLDRRGAPGAAARGCHDVGSVSTAGAAAAPDCQACRRPRPTAAGAPTARSRSRSARRRDRGVPGPGVVAAALPLGAIAARETRRPPPAPRSHRGRGGCRMAVGAPSRLSRAAGPWRSGRRSPGVRSWTRMPCRRASRPTTNRPIRRDTETSTTGGLASRRLASASSSAVMPMPVSVTDEHHAAAVDPAAGHRRPWCPAGENEMAFSTSSASRWTTSLTAVPATATPAVHLERAPARSSRPPTARRAPRRSA